MMKLLNYKLFTVGMMLVMAALCNSCKTDETNTDFTEEGLPAIIQLNVRAEEQADIQTRAVNADIISDLHVLIYDGNGELIGQKYQSTGSGTIKVNTKSKNNCTIYVVANTGDANFFAGYDKHLEKSLTDRIYSMTTWNGLESKSNLPMAVKKTKVDIVAGSQSLGNLEVSRIAAKVTLNIKVATHSEITINDYTIHSLPLKSYYISRPLSTETVITDNNATPGEDAANATDNAQWKDAAKVTVNATSASTTFYMFENRRGVVSSITQQKDKISTKAPVRATYMEINGTIGNVTANWKVYLGANNTSNFNIKRNCNYTYNITLNDAVSVDTRVTLDLSSVTDLSAAGIANCYIAPQASTWYKFKATIRGNGAATAALISPTAVALTVNATIVPKTAELVWEAGQGAYDIKAKDLIQVVLLKDGYIYFKTGYLAEGNAVIAAKDAGGTILWSWHIWKTHFDLNNMPREMYATCTDRGWAGLVYNVRDFANRTLVMMDRNIGAANNNTNDVSAYGMYYQYGRKDPVPGPANSSYNPVKTYPENKISKIRNDELIVQQSLIYSIEHPWIRIQSCGIATKDLGNWIYNGGEGTTLTQSNNLWGNPATDNLIPNYYDGIKTIYDPCPLGWRVPPQDTFTRTIKPGVTSVYGGTQDINVWNTDMNNIPGSTMKEKCNNIQGIKLSLLSNGGSVYIPKHGACYNIVGTAEYLQTDFSGLLLSAPMGMSYGNGAWGMNYTGEILYALAIFRRHIGCPIRCVKEDSYTKR